LRKLGRDLASAILKIDRFDIPTKMKFLLALMRLGHTILGITAPPPEHERAYLLAWTLSLLAIIFLAVGLVLFLVPRIMR